MSNHRDGSTERSLGTPQEPTFGSQDLPPPPAPPAKPAVKPQYAFLSAPEAPDELGRMDKFRVLRLLGKGGMGMVFLAEDKVLHRQVALKVMQPELAANEDAAERFMREARAIAKVNHERIVTLYDVNKANGIPFLVMELLEGLTLHDFLRQGKRLTLAQIARIGRDIGSGLHAAHRHLVIHRDIKPGNIWLESSTGQIKILDFGLARIQKTDQMSSVSGGLLGTPAYMSPEQALGQALDARSDLFSLGTVLYQLCTGHLPFAGVTLFELLEAIARKQPKPVQAWLPAVPGALAELIHHLLAKEPQHRPQSAAIVAERLDDILLFWPPTSQYLSAAHLTAVSVDPRTLPRPPIDETGGHGREQITPPFSPGKPATPARTSAPPPAPPEGQLPWLQTPPGGGGQGRTSARMSLPAGYRVEGRAPRRLPKPLLFGMLGALGCLLAAMVLEFPFHLLMPAAAAKGAGAASAAKIDTVIVLDVTGNMQPQIDLVANSVERFFVNAREQKLDMQVGLVYFRDRFKQEVPDFNAPEDPDHKRFDGKAFTDDAFKLRSEVWGLTARDGGDLAESSLDALDYASKLPFRGDATKVLILITDAPPHIPDKDNANETQVAEKLVKAGIHQLHLFIDQKPEPFIAIQRALAKEGQTGGRIFNAFAFQEALEQLPRDIAQTASSAAGVAQRRVRSLVSEGEFAPSQVWRLLLAAGLWSAFVFLGLTLALVFSSILFMRQALRRTFSFKNIGLSLFTGLVAGLCGQMLVFLITNVSAPPSTRNLLDLLAKLAGWSAAGAILGFCLAFFLPSLSRWRGLLAGVLGGLAGVLLYMVFASLLGSLAGRWLGAVLLGFAVGVFVALFEHAFRRWWLEIRQPAGEVRTLNLSKDLVSVGSDPGRATVVLSDGPPVAFRFFMDGDRTFCEDRNGSFEMQPGDQQQVGSVAIQVCTPESVGGLGLVLELSTGQSIPLSEGLPLTADDLPGLNTTYPDGTVALISPKSQEPDMVLFHNRSLQQWKVTDAQGRMRIIDPGVGLPLAPGTQVDFGRVHGLVHEESG